MEKNEPTQSKYDAALAKYNTQLDDAEIAAQAARIIAEKVPANNTPEVKKFLFNVLNEFLTPIREKRAYYEQHPEEVVEILRAGTADAAATAEKTLAAVKHAMQIDYFERWDKEYK